MPSRSSSPSPGVLSASRKPRRTREISRDRASSEAWKARASARISAGASRLVSADLSRALRRCRRSGTRAGKPFSIWPEPSVTRSRSREERVANWILAVSAWASASSASLSRDLDLLVQPVGVGLLHLELALQLVIGLVELLARLHGGALVLPALGDDLVAQLAGLLQFLLEGLQAIGLLVDADLGAGRRGRQQGRGQNAGENAGESRAPEARRRSRVMAVIGRLPSRFRRPFARRGRRRAAAPAGAPPCPGPRSPR